MIDREAQRTASYTGIEGILLQDQTITESMGEIIDHSFEHLAPSDQMITQTRRRLLRAAQALKAAATPPPGAANPEIYCRPRGGDYLAAADADWIQAYEDQRAALTNRVGPTKAAAE